MDDVLCSACNQSSAKSSSEVLHLNHQRGENEN